MRQLEESALEIATITTEHDSARQQSTVNAPPPTHAPAHSEEPIVISSGTPTQNDSMGQRSGAASEGAAHSMPGMEKNRTAPSPWEPRESRRHVEFAVTSGKYAVTAPMPLKPQRPPCFDPSQRGGPTVQSWVFTMNVFFEAKYVESDAAKIRYAVSLLRGPAMDWWRVIVTSPRAYEPPSHEDGPMGPAVTRSFPICTNSFIVISSLSSRSPRKSTSYDDRDRGPTTDNVLWHRSCLRSTGDPRLILGKGYMLVVLGGYGCNDPLLNKPFYPNGLVVGILTWYHNEVLGFESQCVHFGHPSAGGCQRSSGDPRLILGKGYRLVVLGGYGRTDPLLNKPFYPNGARVSEAGKRQQSVEVGPTIDETACSPNFTDPHRVTVPIHAIDWARTNKEGIATDCPVLIHGKIQGAAVKIFIDGGASHSLVSTATARKMQLTLSRCLPEINARLVDGKPLAIREKLERVKVRCGGNFGFTQEMLATTMDGHDILLGRDWLRRYNPRIDWTTGSCTMRRSGNWVELPRWQSPQSSTVHVNAITMKRAVAAGAYVYVVDIAVKE
ncbi:unnamed protein product [Closterium sp. NIES-54]